MKPRLLARPKAKRLSQRANTIKKLLADCFTQKAADPLFRYVTITLVSLSGDLKQVDVYISLLPHSPHPLSDVLAALNKAKDFFRRYLAKSLVGRGVPQLNFFYDKQHEEASTISQLLSSLDPGDDEVVL